MNYTITYDGIAGGNSLITFTDIPNILKIENGDSGSYATFTLRLSGDTSSAVSGDGSLYITFLGETITNVVDYNNAVNKNFYASSSPVSTAASIARALRNCSTVIANFTVEHDDNKVILKARAVGKMFTGTGWYSSNIPSGNMSYVASDGNANDLVGSLVNVDVFTNGNYVTSLGKNFYGYECAFDMSPLLTTLSTVGRAVPYNFKISYTKNGSYNYLGSLSTNYIVPGYMCNQGAKFLPANSFSIAQNYSRGDVRGVDNNTILYLYDSRIMLSFYNGNTNSLTIRIKYLNSAYEVNASSTTSWSNTDNSRKLWDIGLPLSQQELNDAFYVDVEIGGVTVRYNVIKPIKATEYNQRIYWRNSYGGISFFDFTGAKSETRDVEVSTYQKNIFDYYTDTKNELDKIYDNDVNYVVTLKSHLFEHDGKYVFNDLMQSADVWTERNGETYAIIIDSVSVEEQDRNDIYEATVKYHYSQKPSLL